MAKKPTLTVQLMHAQLRIAELEQQLAAAKAPRAIKVVAHTPWQRPAHMEAARQAAMSGHCVVKL